MSDRTANTSSAPTKVVAGNGIYGLGFLGALIYRIQEATSFWDGAYGVFQALFWPAYLVYDVLDHLGA